MKRTLALLLLAGSCATPTPPPSSPSTASTASTRASAQATLEAFSAKLASAGMSVPLPARICDELVDAEPRFDERVGCVTVPPLADERAVLEVYAAALLQARFPSMDASNLERADALVHAYLAHDDAKLALVATGVERDFDEARAQKKPSAGAKVAHVDAPHEHAQHPDAGPVVDAGASAREEREGAGERAASKAHELVDGGPAPLTLKDRLVGTWVYEGGVVRNIYALCDDGAYAVRFEIVDDSLGISRGDLPEVNGKWEVVDGDPPQIHFTAAGETMDAPVGTLSDDAMEITIDGEDLKLSRRAKTATCE